MPHCPWRVRAFVRVFLDTGAGPGYLGLYTMTEVPDSPYLIRLFGSDDGNLYKPNGTGGRWTVFNRNNFPKRTNADDEDWTDIEDAIAAVNASRTDRDAWRRRIEARFEVNGFLRWLAANTIVGNFDTYGGLSAHNYYVYGSPRHRDRLFWIPWDHDLAMSGGGGLGGGCRRRGDRRPVPPGDRRQLAADSLLHGRSGVSRRLPRTCRGPSEHLVRARARERHPSF